MTPPESSSSATSPFSPAIPAILDDDPGDGMTCEVRRYQSSINSKGERFVFQMGSKLLDPTFGRDNTARRAALVRTTIWSAGNEVARTELEIQSPHMKAALKECVPEYKHFDVDVKSIVIMEEPRCVFHYHEELIAYRNERNGVDDVIAGQHVQFLIDYTFELLMPQLRMFRHFVQDASPPSLDFTNLWMVFVPNELVYVPERCNHQKALGQVLRFRNMTRCACLNPACTLSDWKVEAYKIDFNGQIFGHVKTYFKISEFPGTCNLEDLPVFPLKYHRDASNIRNRLLARGRHFVRLHGRHHLQYNGVAQVLSTKRDITSAGQGDYFPLQAVPVNGTIIVDGATFADWRLTHQALLAPEQRKFDVTSDALKNMVDEELIICNNEVRGFSFNESLWGLFKLENISDIEFNEDAFGSLILDEEYKYMVSSLVRVHGKDDMRFDDIIQGKGKGLVFLLHGEPGLGKTLTVEAVANETRRPILRLDSVCLGSNASEVDAALTAAFALAAKWNAVALLDEADVFLEQRQFSDSERNRLVSVFLKTLEYYEGVLFLNTNRIGAIDKAIKSRINLAIHFPSLDNTERKKLWKTFLKRLGEEAAQRLLDHDELLDTISAEPIDGRQIKNAVRMAHAMALSQGKVTDIKELQAAVREIRKFDAEFSEASRRKEKSDETESSEKVGQKRKRRALD